MSASSAVNIISKAAALFSALPSKPIFNIFQVHLKDMQLLLPEWVSLKANRNTKDAQWLINEKWRQIHKTYKAYRQKSCFDEQYFSKVQRKLPIALVNEIFFFSSLGLKVPSLPIRLVIIERNSSAVLVSTYVFIASGDAQGKTRYMQTHIHTDRETDQYNI